jgi:hypothetical protein
MGSSQSVAVKKIATTCKYNKTKFNELLELIRDAHEVTQFWGKLVLIDAKKLPIKLDEYKNYTIATRDYLNNTKDELKEDILDLDKKGGETTSMYYFYEFLRTFSSVYESTSVEVDDRKDYINKIFANCYNIQKILIEDIWATCDSQQ